MKKRRSFGNRFARRCKTFLRRSWYMLQKILEELVRLLLRPYIRYSDHKRLLQRTFRSFRLYRKESEQGYAPPSACFFHMKAAGFQFRADLRKGFIAGLFLVGGGVDPIFHLLKGLYHTEGDVIRLFVFGKHIYLIMLRLLSFCCREFSIWASAQLNIRAL